MTLVLVVEDVAPLAEQYAYDLRRLGGFETAIAHDGGVAVEMLGAEPVDCVILDLELPGIGGFDVLRVMREREIAVPVVVYTGTGNYDRCIEAVRLGAYGFIDKADPMERVVRAVEQAVEHRRLVSEVRSLREDRESPLIGSSPAMAELKRLAAKLAPIPSPVLVLGESGAGKELVARELHRLSPRSGEPFLAVNCAALPEHLVESELFGHERGAFTGAHKLHRGAFETAGAGTLFLDEVGELPPAAQAKLLRVLEDARLTRVGGERSVPVRARVVAATNRDLDEEARSGRFREDLYYRINVHAIRVPPLRERQSDIPELVRHFVATICPRLGVRPKRVGDDALRLLMGYNWRRNNVRELRNVVERMIIAADGERIEAEHVPGEVRGPSPFPLPNSPVTDSPKTFQELKAEAERQILVLALERNDWHITRTAQELGLADHASLLKIMRRHGLRRE